MTRRTVTEGCVMADKQTIYTHALRSQDTGRVICRVTVPADTPMDQVQFVARNLACQQGIRGVQWLSVNRIKEAA